MLIGCVVEGETEYYCAPKLLGRLGHSVLKPLAIHGSSGDWEQILRRKVIPRVKALALKYPDKIIIILDKEDRQECSPELARRALAVIAGEIAGFHVLCPVAVVIADRYFECILFADYDALDSMPIFTQPVSPQFGETTDGKNVLALVKAALRPGESYRKNEHGPVLAQRIDLDSAAVAARNRGLRKLLKEAPRYSSGGFDF